jgi:two-component system, cell cycle response regulator DivK
VSLHGERSVGTGIALWRRAAEVLAQVFRTSALPEDVLPEKGRAMERRQRDRRAGQGRRHFDSSAPVLGTPSVLLIGPPDDARLLYTCLFEEAGYAVYGVSEGMAAIGVAQQRLPDVVVMEMAAPGTDAFEILHRLREDPLTSSIPAVVMTSLLHLDLPACARASGAVLILETPTLPEILVAEVDQLILTAPPDRAVVRRLRQSLLTLRELGKRFTPDLSAQERVRALIDRLQVAILVLDEQGRYVAVSRGASTLTGYSRAELLSMSVSDCEVASDPDPLLAGPWHEFLTNPQSAAGITIRDKRGNIANIQTAFATLLPGWHAAAFAISEHAADSSPSG